MQSREKPVHGGRHESVELERAGMGRLGPAAVCDDGSGVVSQRHHYSDDGGGTDEGEHCPRSGCSPATVDNIRQRYQQQGREGLRRAQPPGRPSRATAEYRAALRRTVQTPPQHWGYGVSVWSVARLGQHLKHQTGLALSEKQLGRLLPQEEFSFQRPKHTLKGKRDEVAYEQARQELHDMKKKPWRRRPTPC